MPLQDQKIYLVCLLCKVYDIKFKTLSSLFWSISVLSLLFYPTSSLTVQPLVLGDFLSTCQSCHRHRLSFHKYRFFLESYSHDKNLNFKRKDNMLCFNIMNILMVVNTGSLSDGEIIVSLGSRF